MQKKHTHTDYGYRWPWPGSKAAEPDPINKKGTYKGLPLFTLCIRPPHKPLSSPLLHQQKQAIWKNALVIFFLRLSARVNQYQRVLSAILKEFLFPQEIARARVVL